MENLSIITSRPVVDEYDLSATDPSENYYYIGEEPTPKIDGAKTKVIWDKAKKAWVAAKEAGLVDSALQLIKNRRGVTDVPVTLPPPPPPAQKQEEQGLSKNVKIGLIVGGVVVVGVVLYLLLKGDNKSQVVNTNPGV